MTSFLTRVLRIWPVRSCKQLVEDALALHLRGEVRSDGLELTRFHSRLELEWKARDIHPWDRGLSAEQQQELFVWQVLSDAAAAVGRLFSSLPEAETIVIRILDPHSAQTIIRGAVSRSSLAATRPRSNRMWLCQLGLEFRLRDNVFESLEFHPFDVSKIA